MIVMSVPSVMDMTLNAVQRAQFLPPKADVRYTIHLSGFFSPFQNLNSLDDTKS